MKLKLSTEDIKINTVEEAQLAIKLVRKRIKQREQELELRLQDLPKETFKSATGIVIPAFINSKITGRSWNVLNDVVGLFSPFSNNKSELLIDIAKQIGIVGLLKTAIGFFRKKEDVG
jgi:hypothetical protein